MVLRRAFLAQRGCRKPGTADHTSERSRFFVNLVFALILCIDLAKAFGQGAAFGIGLLLLGFIFYPILAFGDARYLGAPVH